MTVICCMCVFLAADFSKAAISIVQSVRSITNEPLEAWIPPLNSFPPIPLLVK
jgi:hypothetical protein